LTVSCVALSDKLTGYLDGELDPREAEEVELHLRRCVTCSARVERERRLRRAVQTELTPLAAPQRLRAEVRRVIRSEVAGARRLPWIPGWAAAAAALVIGLAGGWRLASWQSQSNPASVAAGEVVAGHVRSLQERHLTDIESSEHHTVKPWFAGRLDFSPPVPDFAARGYPLVGGRLDYLGDRQVAALVYRRRQHVINLFVWPSPGPAAAPSSAAERGYHIVSGTAGGMAYRAVSDLNATELGEFARLIDADLHGARAQR
jgi:anti-sigma factor (TIGR02949 family)